MTPQTLEQTHVCPWYGRCIPGVNCSGRGDCRLRNNTEKVNEMSVKVSDLHNLMGNGTMKEILDAARYIKRGAAIVATAATWSYRALKVSGACAGAAAAILGLMLLLGQLG